MTQGWEQQATVLALRVLVNDDALDSALAMDIVVPADEPIAEHVGVGWSQKLLRSLTGLDSSWLRTTSWIAADHLEHFLVVVDIFKLLLLLLQPPLFFFICFIQLFLQRWRDLESTGLAPC